MWVWVCCICWVVGGVGPGDGCTGGGDAVAVVVDGGSGVCAVLDGGFEGVCAELEVVEVAHYLWGIDGASTNDLGILDIGSFGLGFYSSREPWE